MMSALAGLKNRSVSGSAHASIDTGLRMKEPLLAVSIDLNMTLPAMTPAAAYLMSKFPAPLTLTTLHVSLTTSRGGG